METEGRSGGPARSPVRRIVAALLLLAVSAGAQESADTGSRNRGFGLQAAIFTRVSDGRTDLNRDFASLREYPLTPGDLFTLTIWYGYSARGTSPDSSSYTIQLREDYSLQLPLIGAMNAAGMTVPELEQSISEQIQDIIPAQFVSFSLTRPAQFSVFVYGNVNAPGYIAATPMTTVIDALAAAGGFKAGASYRSLALERGAETISLDLSTTYSTPGVGPVPSLRPGDRLFVPFAHTVAAIEGRILYPGAYELLPGGTLADLISYAGGTTAGAQLSRIEVRRVNAAGGYDMMQISMDEAGSFAVRHADVVNIRPVAENTERVSVEGAVFGERTPGDRPVQVPSAPVRLDLPYYPGMTVLAVLEATGGPTPYAVPGAGYVVRASGVRVGLALEALWKTRDLELDLPLGPGDRLVIPIERQQVFVTGMVTRPGAVPYVSGYSVYDYILSAGGYDEVRADKSALYLVRDDGERSEVSRTDIVENGSHITVEQKRIFAADRNVQNFLIAAAWVTAIITATTTVIDFVLAYVVPLF